MKKIILGIFSLLALPAIVSACAWVVNCSNCAYPCNNSSGGVCHATFYVDGCGNDWCSNMGAPPSLNTGSGDPTPPACVASSYTTGSCSEPCGAGSALRTDNCGGVATVNCNNGPCPVCEEPAHRESYERTSDLDAGRCSVGTMDNDSWLDMSEYASEHGKAWTWKCNKTDSSVDCVAYKLGKCGVGTGPNPAIKPLYSSREAACQFGAFNSVHLENAGTVGSEMLKWNCGTGELTTKRVGSFSGDTPGIGLLVDRDYYGPRDGGAGCQCTPTYEYTCDSTTAFSGNCDDNCDGEIIEIYQSHKKDLTCFPNEPVIDIGTAEYLAGSGKHCTNKAVKCAPCGTQDNEGGSYHETAY